MLRVDREEVKPIDAAATVAILDRIATLIGEHDVLVLSDYAKGVLSDTVVAESIALARQAGKTVIVDPKSANLARYAGDTVISPNTREMELASGMDCSEEAGAIAAARKALGDADVVQQAGGRVLLAPLVPGASSAAPYGVAETGLVDDESLAPIRRGETVRLFKSDREGIADDQDPRPDGCCLPPDFLHTDGRSNC